MPNFVHSAKTKLFVNNKELTNQTQKVLAYYDPKAGEWLLEVTGCLDTTQENLDWFLEMPETFKPKYSYELTDGVKYEGFGKLKALAITSDVNEAVGFKLQLIM